MSAEKFVDHHKCLVPCHNICIKLLPFHPHGSPLHHPVPQRMPRAYAFSNLNILH